MRAVEARATTIRDQAVSGTGLMPLHLETDEVTMHA
jgi:hypothetical protein